jgi:hypothetical protein
VVRKIAAGLALFALLGIPGAAASGTGCHGTWEVQPAPQVRAFEFLHAVAAASSTAVWAVGIADDAGDPTFRPLIYRFDGTSWTEASSPQPSGGGRLNGVSALAPDDAWVAGRTDTQPFRTLLEHWDGTTWRRVHSPSLGQKHSGSNLDAIDARSSDDVWAVGSHSAGGNGDASLAERWDGKRWKVVPTPNEVTAGSNYLKGVAAIAPDDVWAAGFWFSNAEFVGRPLVEHWDGEAWSLVEVPRMGIDDNVLYAIAASSPADVWAVGVYQDDHGAYRPLIEHYDGAAWSIVRGDTPDVNQTMTAVTDPAGSAWAVGWSSNTLSERWNGSRWKTVNTKNPGDGNQFFGAAAIDPTHVWAVGNWSNEGEQTIQPLIEYYCA